MTQLSPVADIDASATFPSRGLVRPSTATGALAASVVGLGVLALRLAVIFRYRIDSDETQHLHVVWAWSHGLLQYRDLFDNHMPLFQVLCVPLLRLAGERSEALILARFAMLPLFALMAVLTWRIGVACYPQRAVIAATIIGFLAPDFFLCSVEFRTDVLWAVCWLATIAILVTAPVTPARAAAAGVMLGITASISAKTALLAASLGLAALVAFVLERGGPVSFRQAWRHALGFAAGAVAPPLLVAAYFAAQGAWKPFIHCTVTHNLVSTEHPHRLLFVPLFIVMMAWLGRRLMHGSTVPADVRRRRLFVFLASYIYAAAMISMWPIVETEHWLPFYPLAAVAMIGVLPRRRAAGPLVTAIVAAELFSIIAMSTPWRNQVLPATLVIDQATKLTTPEETVLDLKGEMLFRRRAVYSVLEKITKKAIATGRLPDTIAADILRTHTMVVVRDNEGFPRAGRAFLLRNFVNAGCLRVAGKIVPPGHDFRIEIPGQYAIVSEHGESHGVLDGTPYAGPRFLTAGVHTLVAPQPSEPNAIVWARAEALGFSPFAVDGRCVNGR